MTRTAFLLTILVAWQPQAFSQIVQLPSFHTFSYSGTVEVPDGGTMSLGGNAYSSSARSQRSGLFPGPVARAGLNQAANASVTATIIDHQEIDRQLLGQSPQSLIDRHQAIEAQRNREARGVKPADRTEEGKALVRYARALYQQRRYADSKHTYEMAVAILEPPLQALAIAEMQRFDFAGKP
jgi:hypothetical protein